MQMKLYVEEFEELLSENGILEELKGIKEGYSNIICWNGEIVKLLVEGIYYSTKGDDVYTISIDN